MFVVSNFDVENQHAKSNPIFSLVMKNELNIYINIVIVKISNVEIHF